MKPINLNATTLSAPCPSCGEEVFFSPTSLIRDGGTELTLLFKGVLNKVRCASCECCFVYDSPLTYRDDHNHFVVRYDPTVTNDSLDQAIAEMAAWFKEVFDDFPDDRKPTVRLTLGRQELIEKIAIHKQGYDDRLVEYVKYQLFQNSPGLDPYRMDLLLDFSSDVDEAIMFIAFDRETRRPLYSLGFYLVDYEALRHYFLASAETRRELANLFRGCRVHVRDLFDLNR